MKKRTEWIGKYYLKKIVAIIYTRSAGPSVEWAKTIWLVELRSSQMSSTPGKTLLNRGLSAIEATIEAIISRLSRQLPDPL